MEVNEVRKFKQLEEENRRLKQLVGGLSVDNQALKWIVENLVLSALKREWIRKVQSEFGMSERRVCRLLGMNQATVRQDNNRQDADDLLITESLKELVGLWKRFGFRRLQILLRR